MPLRVLGSMATRALLAELVAAHDATAEIVSVGGVEAARRVREGDPADIVVLSDAAMRTLAADGLVADLHPIVVSSMVAATRTGDPAPDLTDEDAVRQAVLAAGRIGYSTGPSGNHLLGLLDGWGVRATLGARLLQAPPGVPVGTLLADGTVDLAFQQRSELMHLPGVSIAGPLPAPIAADTVFTAGIARRTPQSDAARRLLAFLASPHTDEAKRRQGMQPL